MNLSLVVQQLAVTVPAFLLAISIHEAAHGWMADRLGDPTARMLGRVTLNPLKHLDPVGTLVLILTRFIG
ncbi:MAG: site-2 protease family protein, partial [Nitrospinota bacterium]